MYQWKWILCILSIMHVYAAIEEKMTASQLRSLGDQAQGRNDFTAAASAYTRLIQVEPTQNNYYTRAQLYLRQRKYDRVIPDLNKAMELDKSFVKGLQTRAKIFKLQGRCAEAAADLEQILTLKPGDKKTLEEMGPARQCADLIRLVHQHYNAQQWQYALHYLSQVLETAYQSHELLRLRARTYLKLGDAQNALMDTRKILQSDKSDLEALLIRGLAYFEMGEYDNAVTHWREGLKNDPENAELKEQYKKLRLILRLQSDGDESGQGGRHQEAVDSYKEALTHVGDHKMLRVAINYKICDQYVHLKDGKQAHAACSIVLELHDGHFDALLRRGEASILTGEYQQAINDFQRAQQQQPQNGAAHDGLQRAQRLLKQSQQIDYYKELGVARNANDREIKKAFRKLALQYHPDKHTESDKEAAEKKFRIVAEAYEILADPEMRGKYDRGEEVKPNQGGQQQQHNPFGNFGGFGQQFHFQWG